jgi:hypothetical protein
MLPKTGFLLSGTGVASTAYHLTWLAIACFVISGTLITLAKFFPRVAIEPLRETAHRRWRWRITVNGVAR